MRAAILLAVGLLAACGSDKPEAKRGDDGAPGKGSGLTVSAGTADCAQKPDFVPVYESATILACVASDTGTGKIGGNLSYEVSAPPARIISWSKDRAVAAGLKPVLQSETMLTAEEGKRRSLVVVVSNDETGSQVAVTWGVQK